MATLPKLPPLTAKTGESLTIDQKTFEIKGADTGKVYGQGSSLADALAKQNQLAGGSTPTVSGRPDLFATTPLATEQAAGIQPVVPQKGMAPVAPQVATGAQLAQKAAGTLSTPKAEQKMALTADQQQAKFAEAVKTAVNAGKEKGLEAMYGKPESFDNQLRTQMGLLASALLKETLTPQELRWLSPSQQAAVKSGDENLIRAARGGLNTILQGRMEQQEKEQTRQDKLNAEAETKRLAQAETMYNIYAKIGFDKLDEAQRANLESTLGLPTGTLNDIVSSQPKETNVEYELRSTERGGFIQFKKDKRTGEILDQKIITPSRGLEGTGGEVDLGLPITKVDISSGLDQSSFNTYLLEQEKKANMSFSPEKRKELKEEWEKMQVATNPESVDLSKFAPTVQLIIKGVVKASSLTMSERNKYASQINQAANLGLIPVETTAEQLDTFNKLAKEFENSPLVKAKDRSVVLKSSIESIRKNPKDGATQLQMVYSYVQALDTYQSAVREGELSLVNSIDSRIGQLQGSIQKIQNGQIVRPEVAKQIADAAEQLYKTINSGAEDKEKSFSSRAKVLRIDDQWSLYQTGYNPNYKTPADKALWDNNVSDTNESLLSKYGVEK